MNYNLPGVGLTYVVAQLFGEAPEQQIGEDIRRFKMLMEAAKY